MARASHSSPVGLDRDMDVLIARALAAAGPRHVYAGTPPTLLKVAMRRFQMIYSRETAPATTTWGLELALSEEARPCAARKLSGRGEALLIATAWTRPPEGRKRGTHNLLAGEMVTLTGHEDLSCHARRCAGAWPRMS